MSSVPVKTDYVAEGVGYLRQGFQNRPNIQAMLTAFLEHAQDIENALQGLASGLLLQNATGAVLDNYGQLIGVDREGQPDDVYKLFLYAAIAANNGDATLQTTIELAQQLFDTPTIFVRHPLVLSGGSGVSGAFIGFAVGSAQLPRELWPIAESLLSKNVGAAISSEPITQFNAEKSFAFASIKSSAQNYVAGWGSVNDPSVGGPFASRLSGT